MDEKMAKTKRYSFHPICLLFPELPEADLQQLADDIREKGLLNPVVLFEGKILDGRNRYKACLRAGVEPRFVEWSGDSPLEWVVSENLIRRHLTSSQRAVLSVELLPMLESEAAKRRQLSQGRGKKGAKKLAGFSGNGKASDAAARLTKTNSTYVEAAKSISKVAPDLLGKIRSGVIKIPDALRIAKLPEAERKRVVANLDGKPVASGDLKDLIRDVRINFRNEAARSFARRKTSGDQNILVGGMDLLWDRLEGDSVDLFLTDPPYAGVGLYGKLAELAAAKLKPGRLCLAYSGQLHLPSIIEAMGRHLTYWWTFAIEFAGAPRAIHPRHVQNAWRPILAFAKPPVKPAPEWLNDLLHGGGRDKKHHDWGQDVSEVEYLLNRLSQPGELVVEPFCGGGCVPLACKLTGRQWLATEIDKNAALIARKRLTEAGEA